jgi:predicted mannosyl-3-phosphoglycerate phosphatase (HAD superfamily)
MDHQVTHDAALLTANGYRADQAAEIVLLARDKNAAWIEVLVRAAAERARYQQALELAFPQASG